MIKPSKEFWEVFKNTEGALSCAEAVAIMNIANNTFEGTYIELGSHKGKSGMSAAVSLEEGIFYLVDPIFEDEKIADEVSDKVFDIHFGNLSVIPIADYSYNIIEKYAPYSYVFWDSGEHAGDVLQTELKQLEDAILAGGILCMHDVGNQFTQVTEAYKYLLGTGKYQAIEINWQEIFDYVNENNLEEGNNSWHQYPDLPHPPNFVGALKRK